MKLARSKTEFGAFGNTFLSSGLKCLAKKSVSDAELAIILVDARNGITDQTKRHSIISSILGIPHVLVCVNKMDLVNYDEAVFKKIESDYLEFAKPLNIF